MLPQSGRLVRSVPTGRRCRQLRQTRVEGRASIDGNGQRLEWAHRHVALPLSLFFAAGLR